MYQLVLTTGDGQGDKFAMFGREGRWLKSSHRRSAYLLCIPLLAVAHFSKNGPYCYFIDVASKKTRYFLCRNLGDDLVNNFDLRIEVIWTPKEPLWN